jgi:glycosyltransferase involved in cell wall biosynthesis
MASNAVHTTLTDKDRRGGLTVTVVLTNYNHSRYLRESLGSLFNQTRPVDEYIIIDDASTDDSVAMIRDLISRIPQAKLVQNPENIGCVAGMNKGLSMAKGDIVFFAAADDLFYPALLETGVGLLESYPQAAIFSARSDLVDATGLNKGRFHSPQPLRVAGFLDATAALGHMLRDDGWFMGNTALYRRSALLAEGKFDEKLGSFADGYMCRLLALKYGACFAPDTLAGWRRLEGGMAWSQAMNVAQASNFIALVEARMAGTNGVFPAQYIHRWRRRYIFGGYRFALTQANAFDSSPFGYAKRTFNSVRILWLFLALRPWDMIIVSRRWISEFLDRRALAARVNASK